MALNYVVYNGKKCQIITIDAGSNCVWIDSKSFSRLVKIDEIKPIHLTVKHLEKFGFIEIEHEDGDPTFPYSSFILENDDYSIEITWYDSHDKYEPNTGTYLGSVPENWILNISSKNNHSYISKENLFFHEFQNALNACQIKNTFKP